MGKVPVSTKVKSIVSPILARTNDEVSFPCGVEGRTYFFPNKHLFNMEVLRVDKGNKDKPATVKLGPGIYRYAIWDDEAGDFLEGNSSPIIIVQP